MLRPARLRARLVLVLLAAMATVAAACGADDDPTTTRPFVIGAIPDQDPEKLQRLYATFATYLSGRLGVPVEYRAVTDYTAAVTLFRAGDLDMVWFGGLTGVQARVQVAGAKALVQRDIDEAFHSVFIANTAAGLTKVDDLNGLGQLKGRRFTFGSESSTSGRLMPQYFLDQAGVTTGDFAGQAGYSGSHDATIAVVQAGTFEAGALNEQVWKARTESGQVDLTKVQEIFRTPAYHDYHWVLRPDVASRYPAGFEELLTRAFTDLDATDPTAKEILDLFGAKRFIPTQNSNYAQIEAVARRIGLLS